MTGSYTWFTTSKRDANKQMWCRQANKSWILSWHPPGKHNMLTSSAIARIISWFKSEGYFEWIEQSSCTSQKLRNISKQPGAHLWCRPTWDNQLPLCFLPNLMKPTSKYYSKYSSKYHSKYSSKYYSKYSSKHHSKYLGFKGGQNKVKRR